MAYKPKFSAAVYASMLTPEQIKEDFEAYGFTCEMKESATVEENKTEKKSGE